MENEIQVKENLPRAYSPKEYSFIGFIFSLIPVFIMSFSNAKVLPNGQMLKETMKKILIVFLVLLIANYAVLVWALVHTTKGITQNLLSNPSNYIALMSEAYENIAPADVQLAKTIVQNSSLIFFLSNLILLIIAIRFTNKNELPIFQKMREAKKIQVHSMLIPVLVGIGFIAFQYTLSGQIIQVIAKMFL